MTESNWKSINGKYFAFHKEEKIQSEARAACYFDGGKLYEPKDESMLQNVMMIAKHNGLKSFWLGIKEGSVKGTFLYQTDNLPLVLKNWAPNITQRYNMECVGSGVNYNLNRLWYYQNCNMPYQYVCEENDNGKQKRYLHLFLYTYTLLYIYLIYCLCIDKDNVEI